MKRTNKKGFTIVELVIVIAVIAILAAVLIPTFVSLTNKANMSADQQAVRQMNTLLSVYDNDGTVKNVADAVKVLDKENLDIEDYKPLSKDHYFYFVTDQNGKGRIVLANKNNEVVYPENFKIAADAQWMSLSGMIPMDSSYTVDASGVATVESGAQLAHLMEQVKANKTTVTKVNLPAKIDLKGAAVDFGKVSESISLIGAEGGTELSGVRVSEETLSPTTGEFAGHNYGYGIFGDIEAGATVTISNVTFKDLVVGNTIGTHEEGANTTGLIAGYIKGTLKMENVTIDGCVVNGYQKVGAIVGQLFGTLEMDNVKITNTTVNGYLEVAKIAGYIPKGNLKVDKDTNVEGECNFDGITVKCLAANQVKQSDITFTGGFTLKGDASNTYYITSFKGYENEKWLGAGATNDWGWYGTGENIKTRKDNYDISVNGTSIDNFNGVIWSSSKDFTNGVPAAN